MYLGELVLLLPVQTHGGSKEVRSEEKLRRRMREQLLPANGEHLQADSALIVALKL